MFRSIQYYWCSLCYKRYVRLYISIEFQAFLMCSGIHGNRQVVVQSGAFYQPNEQRAIAARSHVRYSITCCSGFWEDIKYLFDSSTSVKSSDELSAKVQCVRIDLIQLLGRYRNRHLQLKLLAHNLLGLRRKFCSIVMSKFMQIKSKL